MSTKIKINVTKEVLQRSAYCGTPGYVPTNRTILNERVHPHIGSNCAVALAIWDVIPNVWVNSEEIEFYTKNGILIANSPLPEEATDFICDFDDLDDPIERMKMEPISFEIEVPDKVIDLISIEEIVERLKKCSTVELV